MRTPEAPLNLLAVTHYPPCPWGSAKSAELLWHAIAQRGHHVHLLAGATPETRRYELPHTETLPSTLTVDRYEFPAFHFNHSDFATFQRYQDMEHERTRRALPTLLDRYRPDLLVAAHELLLAGVIDLAERHGLPCAVMLRGTPTWQIVAGAYPEDLTNQYLNLCRRTALIIGVGDYFRRALLELGLNHVIHIPNLLDTQKFSPGPRDPQLARSHGIQPDTVVALHASVMSPRKRPEDVLQSAVRALPQAPNLIYLFVGGEDRAAGLKAESRRAGLDNRVRFLDWIDYSQMPEIFRLADMVILASQGEGIARVAVESKACGRPLISSDIPSGREVVDHGVNGLLFRLGDVDDLTAQVLHLYCDPALRASMGTAARASSAQHEIASVADRYIQAFTALTHPATTHWR